MPKRHHHQKARHHHMAGLDEHSMEERDGGMIRNDRSKFANLPTEVMMKAYPDCPAYMDYALDDSIHGIDRQLSEDNAARSRGMKPHKY